MYFCGNKSLCMFWIYLTNKGFSKTICFYLMKKPRKVNQVFDAQIFFGLKN